MNTSRIPVHAGKCQCISFSPGGYITESDNALFNIGGLTGQSLCQCVPFIKGIYDKLLKMRTTDEPLFFPHIRLELENYSGICDLIFSRVRQATGDCFVWFIYDHSMHYGHSGSPR